MCFFFWFKTIKPLVIFYKRIIIYLVFFFPFFFFTIIETTIIKSKTAISAITPAQPKMDTILLPKDIIIPASITPRETAVILVLKSSFKNEAAKVPVQAPVPGNGIPTNINKAQKIPLFPAEAFNFSPPFSPLFRHQVKNFPITFLSLPHSRTFLAK